jgi:hypothetical protein
VSHPSANPTEPQAIFSAAMKLPTLLVLMVTSSKLIAMEQLAMVALMTLARDAANSSADVGT